ncbi:MAG: shikimate kinase [Nitrososphaerales archaeon]
MKGRAVAHGAVSIVNAISIGKGAALGVSLETEAEVKVEPRIGMSSFLFKSDTAEDPVLAKTTVKEVLNRYREGEFDVTVSTKSQIPAGKGLKSSSVASNAVALATLSALGERVEDMRVVNLGVDASLKAGVTITGAFDDACASFFGGFVVTDNTARKIVRQEPASEDLAVLIYIPEEKMYTKDFDKGKIIPFRQKVSEAFDLALQGEYWKAMILNGQVHSSALGLTLKPAQEALDSGALAAGLSGTGPAVAALCDRNVVEEIKARWRDIPGDVLVTSVNNSKAEGVCLDEG